MTDAVTPEDAHRDVEAGSTTPYGVLQHHGDGSRAGLYVDSAFTKSRVRKLEALPGFSAEVSGDVYAQPLFLQAGVNGKSALFVVTETNDVYAVDADTGARLWRRNVGTPEPASAVTSGCGSVFPLGITSTPIIDLPSRSLLVSAMVMVSGVAHYEAFALALDTGTTLWSADLAAVPGFASALEIQRGALAIANGVLYIPFSGLAGDCGDVHGWVVTVALDGSHAAHGWHTAAVGSDIWGPSGVATDGTSVYVATASNATYGVSPRWADSNAEAILRIAPGPTFSGQTADYFAPTDWFDYDTSFSQLGSAGVVLLDLPGSHPAKAAFAVGKLSDAYLVDRTNLGGISNGAAHLFSATSDWVEGAMAAYDTGTATYVALAAPGASCPAGTDLSTLEILPGSPPTVQAGWCARQGGVGSPIVTASSAASGSTPARDLVVWGLGTGNSQTGSSGSGRLSAFDGATGALLAESKPTMLDLEHWISPIVARGRVYVAGNTHLYAFDLDGAAETVSPGTVDAGDASGPPAACFLVTTPDQTDVCAAFGLSCQGNPDDGELGTCQTPTLDQPCTASVGCSGSATCANVESDAGTKAMCIAPCTTTADCSDPFRECRTSGAVSYCAPAPCSTYYASCSVGEQTGTCLPFFEKDGTTNGVCAAAGSATASCSAARVPDADAGALCTEGNFCYAGTSTSACLPFCSFTSAAFDFDAGGPSCASGSTCIILSETASFGACATTCGGDAGSTCASPLTCRVWNPLTNEKACLP